MSEHFSLTSLVAVDPATKLATFTDAGKVIGAHAGLDPILALVRAKIDDFEGDASTEAGRDRIKAMARAVVSAKTALEAEGEKLAAEMKAIPKLIDAGRRYARETLDAWNKEVRKPADDWEAADKIRTDRLLEGVTRLDEAAEVVWSNGTLETLRATLAEVEAVEIGDHLQEYRSQYFGAKQVALDALRTAIGAREVYEAEQVELARHRAEKAEREAKDREDAEARRVEAEASARAARVVERERAQAEAARVAAETEARRQREAIEAAAKSAVAEVERQNAELREQAAAAVQRIVETEERAAREVEERRAADARREANVAHCRRINQDAVAALVGHGVEAGVAKKVVTLIARKAVPAVSIAY